MAERWTRSLQGAWRTLKWAPLEVLLPVSALLLLEAALVWTLGKQLGLVHPMQLGGVWLAARALISLLAAPIRAWLVATAGRRAGLTVSWVKPLPFLIAAIAVEALAVAVATAIPLAVGIVLASFLASQGWFVAASLLFALLAVLGGLLRVITRSLFAYVPAVCVLETSNPVAMPGVAWRAVSSDLPGTFLLLIVTDMARGLGGLLLGAGALPAYPLADLSFAHRFLSQKSATT